MNTGKIGSDAVKLWLLFFAAGLLLLFFRIGHESVWFDESYSAALIRHTIPQIWAIAGQDSHPPLYFILLRFFSMVFGNGLAVLRSFSAISIVFMALLGPFSIRRALGTRTSLIYTFLVFTLPILISFAQETRMYTLAAYFVTGAAVYGFLAARDAKKSDWVKFALFAIAGCYTHYFGLLAIMIYIAVLFTWIMIFRRSQWKVFLVSAFVIFAAYLPWLSSLAAQVGRVSREFWIEPLTLEGLWYILLSPFDSKFNWFFFSTYLFFLSLALIGWGFGRAIIKKYNDHWFPLLAFSAYLLTIMAGVIASIVIRPVFISRYMVPLAGLFIIPIAYGISRLDRHSWIKWISAIYLILCIPMIILIHRGRNNGPMNEVVSYIQPRVTKDTVFLHTSEHTLGTFSYHFPNNRQILYFYPGFRGYSGYSAFAPKGEVCYGGDLNGLLKGQTNIWLVTRPESQEDRTSGKWLLSGKAEPAGPAHYFALRFAWFIVMAMPIRWHSEIADLDVSERNDWPSDFHKRGNINIKIRNFRNDDGVAECALYYEQHQEAMTDPGNAWLRKSIPIRNRKANVSFKGLPYGSYSVLVYQDTNQASTNTNFTVNYGNDNWGLSGNFQRPMFQRSRLVLEKPDMDIIIPVIYLWQKGAE